VNEWLAIEKDAEIEVATLDWGFPLDPVWQSQRKRRNSDGLTLSEGEGSHLEEHNSTTKRAINI